jgi:hypothetical protein
MASGSDGARPKIVLEREELPPIRRRDPCAPRWVVNSILYDRQLEAVPPELDDYISSKAWSEQIAHGTYEMSEVLERDAGLDPILLGLGLNNFIRFTAPLTRDRLSYWPKIGVYAGSLRTTNRAAYLEMLFEIERNVTGVPDSPLEAAKFTGAVVSLWCSMNEEDFIETDEMAERCGNVAWCVMFASEPTVGDLPFLGPEYCDAWRQAVRGTRLQNWRGNWPELVRSPVAFELFLDISATVRALVITPHIRAWSVMSLQSACLGFIGTMGMTAAKHSKIEKELRGASAVIPFLTLNDLKVVGPIVRECMARCKTQVDRFLALGHRQIDSRVQIYTSNTYARAVMGGLAAMTIIFDVMRRLPDDSFWGALIKHFPTDALSLYKAFGVVYSRPYIGYADNVEKAGLVQARYPSWFSVCRAVAIEVLGDTNLSGLIHKGGGVPKAQLEKWVEAARDLIQRPIELEKTPQDVLDQIVRLKQELMNFDDRVGKKIA